VNDELNGSFEDVSEVPRPTRLIRASRKASNLVAVDVPKTERPVFISPAERVRAFGSSGDPVPTGFDSMDIAMRGGPRKGTLGVFGGAPGAGKTTLAVNIAKNQLENGIPVAILAADEDPDGLLIRIGQSLGFHREDFEAANNNASEAFAQMLERQMPGLIVADGDVHSLEDVVERLLEETRGGPGLLIVDSIQRARAIGTSEAKSEYERADAAVSACKRAARAGLIVIATSELNRGSYRSQDSSERIADLAAFKHSGSIEYAATFAVVLRNVPDEGDLVDVTFAKNRLRGPDAPEGFRLRLDRHRAWFAEVDRPDEPSAESVRTARFVQAQEQLRESIRRAVRENPYLGSKDAVCVRVPKSRKPVRDMVNAMLGEGSLVQVNGVFRVVEEGESP
jgi:KaiC/GvpD/RAD55 family RecA-like ATPase